MQTLPGGSFSPPLLGGGGVCGEKTEGSPSRPKGSTSATMAGRLGPRNSFIEIPFKEQKGTASAQVRFRGRGQLWCGEKEGSAGSTGGKKPLNGGGPRRERGCVLAEGVRPSHVPPPPEGGTGRRFLFQGCVVVLGKNRRNLIIPCPGGGERQTIPVQTAPGGRKKKRHIFFPRRRNVPLNPVL